MYGMVRTLTSEVAAAAPGGGGVTSSLEPPLPPPVPDGAEPVYSKKIRDLVSEISQLTLLETAQLNELLKVNICIVNFTLAIFVRPNFGLEVGVRYTTGFMWIVLSPHCIENPEYSGHSNDANGSHARCYWTSHTRGQALCFPHCCCLHLLFIYLFTARLPGSGGGETGGGADRLHCEAGELC